MLFLICLEANYSPALPSSAGVSASYTVGGITIAGVFNNKDAVGGTAGSNSEFKEVSVAFAF